ncbi:MAG: hypothetical protein HC882_00165 [Acidobacteria bacterium]|nr:hypothetical protein [Acidobacteriota bacterium]
MIAVFAPPTLEATAEPEPEPGPEPTVVEEVKPEIQDDTDILLCVARTRIERFHGEVSTKWQDRESMKIDPLAEQALAFKVTGSGKNLLFPRLAFDLSHEGKRSVRDFLQYLESFLNGTRPEFSGVYLAVEGSADLSEFKRLAPPRDNFELSALRAATVVREMEEVAPSLRALATVVGLGPQGDPARKVDPSKRYVRLQVKVDLAQMKDTESEKEECRRARR